MGAEREKAAGDGTPIHRHSTPQPQPIHERVVEEPDAAAPVTEEPTDAVELSPHTHKLHKLEAMLNHDMDVDDLLRELDLSDDEDGPGNVNGSVVEENPLGKEELDALKDERVRHFNFIQTCCLIVHL